MIVSCFKRFHRDQRGNVAMIFALAAVPLIAAVGCAIDYGRVAQIHSKFESAADAASVSSISQTSRAYAQAQSMNADGPVAVGNADASSMFTANLADGVDYTLDTVTPNVVMSNGNLTSTVQYTVQVPTIFMKIVGIKTMSASGQSVATNVVARSSTVPNAPYADFYFLLDNSPSMSIGATPTDMNNLYNLTTNTADGNCAFACHITSRPLPVLADGTTQQYDNYEIARQNNVTLRFDEVVSATQQAMSAANAAQAGAGHYRFAIYDYGATADSIGLTNTFPLSYNLSNPVAATNNLSLMTVTWWGDNDDSDTPHNTILPAINAVIPAAGSGASPQSPQEFLFIVSDGVSDESNPSCSTASTQPPASYATDAQGDGSMRCSMPIDPALCQPFKDRGVQVGVLYTTYFSLATPAYPQTDPYYQEFVMPYNSGPYQPSLNSQIAKNMQACASPGLYFEISPTLNIPTAMGQLFNAATSTLGPKTSTIGPHLKS
jgi:Flp pilus assembly protein TadG